MTPRPSQADAALPAPAVRRTSASPTRLSWSTWQTSQSGWPPPQGVGRGLVSGHKHRPAVCLRLDPGLPPHACLLHARCRSSSVPSSSGDQGRAAWQGQPMMPALAYSGSRCSRTRARLGTRALGCVADAVDSSLTRPLPPLPSTQQAKSLSSAWGAPVQPTGCLTGGTGAMHTLWSVVRTSPLTSPLH